MQVHGVLSHFLSSRVPHSALTRRPSCSAVPANFFSFLAISREGVLVVPARASRAVIFPNRWFCLAEWSWLSTAILTASWGMFRPAKQLGDSQRKSHTQLISCESQAGVSEPGHTEMLVDLQLGSAFLSVLGGSLCPTRLTGPFPTGPSPRVPRRRTDQLPAVSC